MSGPIKLPGNYGKIPENKMSSGTWTMSIRFLLGITEQKDLPDIAGTCEYKWVGNRHYSFRLIPIKQRDEVKGWLISDLKDKSKKYHQSFPAEANIMILKNENNPNHEPDMFFTKYGKSFANENIEDKYLDYNDAQKIKSGMYEVDPYYDTCSFPPFAKVFSFFSRRLSELGQDENLGKLQAILGYCSDLTVLACPASAKKLAEELQNVLPSLISSYKNKNQMSSADKQCLILLNAIHQQSRRLLKSVRHEQNPDQQKIKIFLAPEREKPKCSRVKPILNLQFDSCSIGNGIEFAKEAKAKLKDSGRAEDRKALRAIRRWENCLTAIYAKDAEQKLQTDDLTCFEILTHVMKLRLYDCLPDEYKKKLDFDSFGLPFLPAKPEEFGFGLSDDPNSFAGDPCCEIALSCPRIASQHYWGAEKFHAGDLMYRWALQHAEEMGVPVGSYKKLETRQYEALSGAAKLDEPEEKLKKLEQDGLLKEKENSENRTSNLESVNKNSVEISVKSEENGIGQKKKEIDRQRISATYLSSGYLRTIITLTPQQTQQEQQAKPFYIPDDKILMAMAEEAGWKTGRSTRLLDAVKEGKNEGKVKKYAVQYLIYKLKFKDCDENDVQGSLDKLRQRGISDKDLQRLDRPSMAKVILAANKCGLKINPDCQESLEKTLQRPHIPSIF